jgi:hypothetical protein
MDPGRRHHPGDVRPAHAAGAVLDEVTIAWVAAAAGLYRTALTPLRHADVWRVDEGGKAPVRCRRHLQAVK